MSSLDVIPSGEYFQADSPRFEYMSLAVLVGGKTLALGPGILPNSLARLETPLHSHISFVSVFGAALEEQSSLAGLD